jgi:hypothetical protein
MRAGAFPPRLVAGDGVGTAGTSTPDAQAMLELAAARMGWAASDFSAVRLEVPYPPMPSACILRYDLPP